MRVTVPRGASPGGHLDHPGNILGVRDERIGPAVADVDRLVDEGISLRCLLGDNADGSLEDVALLPGQSGGYRRRVPGTPASSA
jgi:hypothetical protein